MADDYVEAEPSPSNCNYCYALDCGIRIESTSSLIRGNTIVCKTAKIIVGRSADRKIVLQVEMQGRSRGAPAVTSYPLQDCRVHEQNVQKGSGGIEIPSRKLVIHVCNCAPRKLNVFLKTLRAKLDLMNVDNEGVRTPVGLARHRLLNGGLPDIFNKLSPLTVGEIRRIRRIRGVESPLAKSSSGNGRTPVRQNPTQTSPRGIKRSSGEATPKRETPITVRRSIPSDRVQLSAEQRNVVRAVVSGGQNVFFTGSAGTGKSLVLRRIIEMLPATTTVVTAATGVAACQLGGVTLHSFAGIGVGGTKEDCLRNAQAKKLVVRAWKSITHLIIDEISMVDADYFTCLEYVARKIRGGEPRPFGGIQLVITGDFLQLPPVVPNGQRPKFCFESTAWRAAVTTTILLREVRRQNDDTFIKILQEIRVGNCPSWATSALKATQNRELAEGVVPTRLCTHTTDAEKLNQHSLRQLDTMEKVFEAEDSEPISDQSGGLIPRRLVLKTMAQVMLTKNLDLSRGLSNGARGVVEAFAPSGFPLVRFVACSEAPIELRPVRFHMRSSVTAEQTAIRRQLPLQLAWAISIHKSQGLTLDAVEMSLQRVFAEGQAYVALSRARSLDALQINGFEPECVKANQKVVRFYDSLRDCEAGTETDDMTAFIIRKRSRPSV